MSDSLQDKDIQMAVCDEDKNCEMKLEISESGSCKSSVEEVSSRSIQIRSKAQITEDEHNTMKEEVAIETNVDKIKGSSGYLPQRKRCVPVKFSDYRIFTPNSKGEDEEEVEETADRNFTHKEKTARSFSNKTEKPKRSRGRPKEFKTVTSNEFIEESSLKTNTDDGNKELKKHSIVKVSNGFKCCTCRKIFSLRGNAKAHLITHTDFKPFKCDYIDCGRSLRTKEALRRHKLSHLGIKSYKCLECNRMFSCNFSLQEHLSLHTGEKPFSCDICGLKFRQTAVLKRHFSTHSNSKPYECGVCGRKFALQAYVRSHMKTHTGDRPFICDVCNKSFAHGSDLNRHKIIHSGKKPYPCSVCNTRYSDPSSRRRHEREHEKEHLYVCHVCQKRFPRAGQLRVHLVKEHTRNGFMEEKSPWDSNVNPNNRLVRIAHEDDVERGVVKTVQIILDSSTPNLVEHGKEVNSTAISENDIPSDESNGQTMVMEFPSGAEQLAGLPRNGTYKVISSGDDNQIYEVQVEKDSQLPLQLSDGEMKICFSDLKIKEGVLAYIENGDTVTIIEQADSLTSGQPSEGLVLQKADDQECSRTKGIGDEKVQEISNSVQITNTQSERKVNNIAVFETPSEKMENNVQNGEQDLDTFEVSSSSIPDKTNSSSSIPDNSNSSSSVPNNSNSSSSVLNKTNSSSSDNIAHSFENNDSSLLEKQNASCEGSQSYTSSSAISSIFIDNPDLNSQDYYNWLAVFSEECKTFVMPLSKEVFQKISQVQKTLSDFMAMPTGVITDKNNFKILMGITQDLSHIISSHLAFTFSNMNK